MIENASRDKIKVADSIINTSNKIKSTFEDRWYIIRIYYSDISIIKPRNEVWTTTDTLEWRSEELSPKNKASIADWIQHLFNISLPIMRAILSEIKNTTVRVRLEKYPELDWDLEELFNDEVIHWNQENVENE